MRPYALAALLLASAANATTTLTTGIGLDLSNNARCEILNASTKPVEVDSVTFIRPDGATAAINFNTCTFPGVISPGLACSVTTGEGGLYRCEVVTKGNSKSIRVDLLLIDGNNGVSILEGR
jgi:hypothetical protein